MVSIDTCIACTGAYWLSSRTHPFVLVDEAAQAAEPEVIIPMSRLRGADGLPGRLTLIRDHKQLPPVCGNKCEEEHWQRSLLERLPSVVGLTPVMLNIQSRMLEPLAAWPSYVFYENKLQTAAQLKTVGKHLAGFPWPQHFY